MNKKDPTEILNDNMEFLVDYLKRELRCLGKMNGLSDTQISGMERDFIARLAFAAIIGDDNIIGDDKKKDECEDCPANDCCSFKRTREESEKSEGLPSDVINALLYVKRMCESHECDECPFGSSGGLFCNLSYNPKDWEV